jgi:hypothetical protein
VVFPKPACAEISVSFLSAPSVSRWSNRGRETRSAAGAGMKSLAGQIWEVMILTDSIVFLNQDSYSIYSIITRESISAAQSNLCNHKAVNILSKIDLPHNTSKNSAHW